MYARDVQRHYEGTGWKTGRDGGGNEKMQLRATRRLRKKSRSQAAGNSNFSRLSLSQPPVLRPLFPTAPLIFVAEWNKLEHQTPLFYGQYTFSFLSLGTTHISRNPNKRDSGFSGHLSCLRHRNNGKSGNGSSR